MVHFCNPSIEETGRLSYIKIQLLGGREGARPWWVMPNPSSGGSQLKASGGK
jgi:hypothetical protein